MNNSRVTMAARISMGFLSSFCVTTRSHLVAAADKGEHQAQDKQTQCSHSEQADHEVHCVFPSLVFPLLDEL
jgi:hypothetical protein